jgi:7-carboxy-7-deazaguanine synthase
MPAHSTLKINDIFWSFQGEGLRMGLPAIFLRLAGCSLRCPYCDQKEAWVHAKGTTMTVPEIVNTIEKLSQHFTQSQVIFTGGEPQEQNLADIANTLKEKGFFLAIETNGKQYQSLPLDWWTVAPKDVNNYDINPQLIPHISELKLVANDNLNIDAIKKVRHTVKNVPIFLQPEGYDKDRYPKTFSLFQQCQEAGLENIRCGIQLHTVYQVK